MKKTLKIALVAILALCIMVPVMAANENITSSLSASQNKVKREEKFTITVQLNNLPTSNTKALEGKISFDSSKLELVNNENLNGWITTLSTDGTGMASYKTGSSTANEAVLKLTFKVKDSAELGDTTISVANMQIALEEGNGEADSEISVAESNTKISIINSDNNENNNNGSNNNGSNNNGSNNNGSNNNGSNNNGSNNNGSSNNGNSNNGSTNNKNTQNNAKDNTISGSSQHAKTGDIQSIVIATTITILVITSITVYFKYKKMDI